MVMPGRSHAVGGAAYRYGMNGQEKENEVFEGASSAEYWMYDSRLGRRWEVDPITYEGESPFVCFSNNPIVLSDPSGLADAKKMKPKPRKRLKSKYTGKNPKQGKKRTKKPDKNKGDENDKKGKKDPGTDPTKKQKAKKEGNTTNNLTKGTIYIYRVTKGGGDSWAIKNEISDGYLKNVIAPEIERIMNNNWINTQFEVKIITQEVAATITSEQLLENNASIHPIISKRSGFGDNAIGLSSPGRSNGLIETSPFLREKGTYINLARVNEHATFLKTISSYMLSYIIAHESVHQFYIGALVKTNKWMGEKSKEHTGTWPNLNKDGNYLNPSDLNQSMPFPSKLKNRAEWIPMDMKNTINSSFKQNIRN